MSAGRTVGNSGRSPGVSIPIDDCVWKRPTSGPRRESVGCMPSLIWLWAAILLHFLQLKNDHHGCHGTTWTGGGRSKRGMWSFLERAVLKFCGEIRLSRSCLVRVVRGIEVIGVVMEGR